MYEFDKSEAPRGGRGLHRPDDSYRPVDDIVAASLLFWGEHCIECAAPACYQTCDLYQARPDGHCRRFTWGIARNRAFASLRGYGAEVAFKKWGKLEARGNTSMLPRRGLVALERTLGWSAPVLNGIGTIAYKISKKEEWRDLTVRLLDRLGRWLHRRTRRTTRPDAFLLEVYNPATTVVCLQVAMAVARNELARALEPTALLPSVRRKFKLPPGYSRHAIAFDDFAAVTEVGLPFDVALIPEAETDPTLIFLTADFVKFGSDSPALAPAQTKLPAVKCVVWDLDNTVWDGILLEDDAVRPEPAVLELIRALDERGILLSVASKNDYVLATAKMAEIGIAEYVLFPQIGWLPKSDGIKVIAEKLNIGLDTFAFVDDNPFELDEVARALPMVTCINARDIRKLASDPRFAGSATAESKRRRSMYREAMNREQEERKFDGDFFDFLRSCEMKLIINKYLPHHFERVSELVQRTNQLNFSGRKYKREEVDPILSDERLEKWVVECSDKFGSYGIVGFGLVSRSVDKVEVQDFMLSCRVQGRFVEQAFFNALVANDSIRRQVWVNFHATGKNEPARQVLSAIGFEDLPGGQGMELDLRQRDLSNDFIAVESEIDEIEQARSRELETSSQNPAA